MRGIPVYVAFAVLMLMVPTRPGAAQVVAGAALGEGERFRSATASQDLGQLPTSGEAFSTAPLPVDSVPVERDDPIFLSGFESP